MGPTVTMDTGLVGGENHSADHLLVLGSEGHKVPRSTELHTFMSLKNKGQYIPTPYRQVFFGWYCPQPVWAWGCWGSKLLLSASLPQEKRKALQTARSGVPHRTALQAPDCPLCQQDRMVTPWPSGGPSSCSAFPSPCTIWSSLGSTLAATFSPTGEPYQHPVGDLHRVIPPDCAGCCLVFLSVYFPSLNILQVCTTLGDTICIHPSPSPAGRTSSVSLTAGQDMRFRKDTITPSTGACPEKQGTRLGQARAPESPNHPQYTCACHAA